MQENLCAAGIRLPMQTPAAITTANAIHDAFTRFCSNPTSANQTDAMGALQAHLAAIEKGPESTGKLD